MDKARRMVLTGSFAAVAAVGAIYGAGLKTRQELSEATRRATEVSLDEQIAVLEESRAQLVARKAVAEQKIAELDARIRARRAKEMEEKEKVAAADREAVGKR